CSSENRLDVTHYQVATGPQRVEQRLDKSFLSSAIQVDDDVATCDEIERRGSWRVSEYVTSFEPCDRANRGDHRSSVSHSRKQPVEYFRRSIRERCRQICRAIRRVE